MKKFINKYKYHILSFIIPIIIILLILFTRGYLTKKVIMQSDMMAQYTSLFNYFSNVLKGDESIFYSFSKGLGGSILGTFAYYLASPINLILFLFNNQTIPYAMLLILLLKVGLSGLTFNIYLKDKMNNKVYSLIMSLCYALMAYSVNYYFNIMWLDGIYLAPLILLGIDKLIDGKSIKLYTISLFLAIFSNYYIGFMLCIFSCIYFIYSLLISKNNFNKKELKKIIIRFFITSLLAGLMTFCILIPTVLELSNGARSINNISFNLKPNINLLDIFSKSYLATHNSSLVLNPNTVNWYCGIINIILVSLYFCNKNITKKEKIYSFLIIIIFLISFMIPFVNNIWHGFLEPQFFNYRYSFLFSLFLLVIASKSLNNLNITKIKSLIMYLVYIITSLIVILSGYEYITNYLVYLSVVLASIYLILLYLLNKKEIKENNKKLITMMLVLTVIGELICNYSFTIDDYNYYTFNEYNDYIELGKKLNKYQSDDEFYRLEQTDRLTSNNSFLQEYKGITTFLSSLNQNQINFFGNIGTYVGTNSITYNGGNTPLVASLLGLKYTVYTTNRVDYYDKIDTFNYSVMSGSLYRLSNNLEGVIYENKKALSLGYMINYDEDLYKKTIENGLNNFEYQNLLVKTMIKDSTDILIPYEVINEDKENASITYKIDNNKNIYIKLPVSFSKKDDENVSIYINESLVKTISPEDTGIFVIPNKYENSEIEVTFKVEGNVSLDYPFLYYLDDSAYESAIYDLKRNELNLDVISSTYLKGDVTAVYDKQVLFTSIPYEEGWSIYVDGKKTDVKKLYDTFIGVELSVGKHTVEFKYKTPGLNIGITISTISFILFILYDLKYQKKVQKRTN